MSENKELKITSANYEAAYAMADDNTRKILAVLVGDNETTATPSQPAPSLSDYTTIRSYEDACVALGESMDVEKLVAAGVPNHIIAQMKLEHICKALWGGENKCQPTADGSKVWWYPVMALWTPGEISNMSDDERRALLSAIADPGAFAGFGSLTATYRSSYSIAYGGFRLCLDTEEKAEYFGKQFVELWAEAYAYNFTVGGHLE
ncbi:hypothetical protein [Prevotella sp. MGM2]|uniref:hypothetical protein n=1 Tax=Prevotella sp. MGM2 TaxID=2033406 RepID=UPI000CE9B1C4|nr:hypothetical protein [Prevotella sp. MGM2]GAY30723.1 hypothetical protein PvtlMGM2_1576 [Prevotella sp. MGM2]